MSNSLKDPGMRERAAALYLTGSYSGAEISRLLCIPKTTINDFLSKTTHKEWWAEYGDLPKDDGIGPKILTLDIETAPLKGTVWGIWNQNIPIERIDSDWYVLSWAAKWFHEDSVFYEDKRDSWDTEDDATLLEEIWWLLDEADIIITQNGKKFDTKKLNARFLMNGFQPPSSYRHIDTCEEARKYFGFTSNKLAFLTDKLCKKYKKLPHGRFPGNVLWDECLKGNMEAWDEMEEYNIYDVLSLEELYTIMRPWMKGHPNLSLYSSDRAMKCRCGSEDFTVSGFHYTQASKFQKFKCDSCGAEVRDNINLLHVSKRKTIMRNVL